MGRKSIQVKVGDIVFESKFICTHYFKSMLHSYKIGEKLNNEDHNMMYNLLLRHPSINTKISQPIKYFLVEKTKDWGIPTFTIKYIDGTKNDFSYIKCINGKQPSQEIIFDTACRSAVQKDINDFRRKNLGHPINDFIYSKNVLCPIYGYTLTYGNTDVDHVAPMVWKNIVRKFIYKFNIDIYTIDIPLSVPGTIGLEFSDRRLAHTFRIFHKENATLRVISKCGNATSYKNDKLAGVYDIPVEQL